MAKPEKSNDSRLKIKYESNGLMGTFGSTLFDASKVLQSKAYGTNINHKLKWTGYSSGGAVINADKSLTNTVGAVHVIQYIPSLGGFRGALRYQNAMKDQFVSVVGDAYSKIDLNECDLSKLQVYGESIIKLIVQIDRAIEVYDYTSGRNIACGPALVSACGFEWNDLSLHRQSFIDVRNAFAEIVNTKLYVGNNQRLDKELYLLSRVFVSDASDKTEFAVYVPGDYLDIDMTNGDLSIRTSLWDNWEKASKLITLTALNTIKGELDIFCISAWFNEVSPYLFHIYGDNRKNLFNVAPFSATSGSFVYTYNPVVNSMIRNADYLDDLYDAESSTKTAIIFEDSEGHLCQGARGTAGIKTMSVLPDWSMGANVYAKLQRAGKLVTLDNYEASVDEVVTAFTSKVLLGNEIFGDTNMVNEARYGVMWSGPVLHMKNVVYVVNNVDNPTSILKATPCYLHRHLVNHTEFSSRYVAVDTIAKFQGWVVGTDRFRVGDFTPNITYMQFGTAAGAFENGPAQYGYIVHDLDNYFNVDDETLESFFYAFTYESGKIIVPEFTSRK